MSSSTVPRFLGSSKIEGDQLFIDKLEESCSTGERLDMTFLDAAIH